MEQQQVFILGIESSCDDTAAAIICDRKIISAVVASQEVHKNWGGIVPELASRAHQQNIVPVVEEAIRRSKIHKRQLKAIAYTRGPGLLGSLLVGSSFAKGLAMSLGIPLIEVNHMQGHILAHFIDEGQPVPAFPFLCLTVSGGHTQIVKVHSHLNMEIIGETQDDAAGEAFDKAARLLGFPYPGGVMIDRLSAEGNPERFRFTEPKAPGYNFSFSGLKTSFQYLIRDELKKDADFIENNKADLCASLQKTIVDMLMNKLLKAAIDSGIKHLALAGGVSANSGLRKAFLELEAHGYQVFIPPFEYCTDNAAMIAITGYYKYI
ncbi:MAG: tRNA (adenosine(37)-N6)-threonylcarbamoyltransferase complex transferase subunit TsaD, partial [Bacteroidetes bacterium]|nr:tRNA (adenosine(37)-N6)-threonylcarbamoyltransferase complex transferase subunit TsaD [Bacteroidota bacterium]